MLQPGQFCVVTNDTAAFVAKYGNGVLVAGQFTGSLNNSGEPVVLNDASGNPIHDFSYSNVAPWPLSADGFGPSIEAIGMSPTLYGNGTNWRASQETGGSPGYLGLGIDSDFDGSPDSVEVAFGTDPNNAASSPAAPTTVRDPGTGAVTITWNSVSNRSYTVEYRDDLTGGDWQPLATIIANSGTTNYTDVTASGVLIRFYHIKTQFP